MSRSAAPSVAIVGAGPGGLMAAEVLAAAGVRVTVFDRSPTIARKFLIAGRGGLNITHSEPLERFLDRYGAARSTLEPAIAAFTPDDLRAWCASLDEEAFVGTSGRVFPKSFRATQLAHNLVERLDELDVEIFTRCEWRGWEDPTDPASALVFTDPKGGTLRWTADATVLSLGGASWPRTGSDGGWVPILQGADVEVSPLRPANCGFTVDWSETFRERFAHQPLKNVRLTHIDLDGTEHTARGEAMVTDTGIEGGVVYALSRELRRTLEAAPPAHGDGPTGATVLVDLAPDVDRARLVARLGARRRKESTTRFLRRAARLGPEAIGLVHEAVARSGGPLPDQPEQLAALITAVPVVVTGTDDIDRAISTAGGVALGEVDEHFQLRRRPGTYVVGEMLDWDAPTGGYLLQATFSTAVVAARAIVAEVVTGRRP